MCLGLWDNCARVVILSFFIFSFHSTLNHGPQLPPQTPYFDGTKIQEKVRKIGKKISRDNNIGRGQGGGWGVHTVVGRRVKTMHQQGRLGGKRPPQETGSNGGWEEQRRHVQCRTIHAPTSVGHVSVHVGQTKTWLVAVGSGEAHEQCGVARLRVNLLEINKSGFEKFEFPKTSKMGRSRD